MDYDRIEEYCDFLVKNKIFQLYGMVLNFNLFMNTVIVYFMTLFKQLDPDISKRSPAGEQVQHESAV